LKGEVESEREPRQQNSGCSMKRATRNRNPSTGKTKESSTISNNRSLENNQSDCGVNRPRHLEAFSLPLHVAGFRAAADLVSVPLNLGSISSTIYGRWGDQPFVDVITSQVTDDFPLSLCQQGVFFPLSIKNVEEVDRSFVIVRRCNVHGKGVVIKVGATCPHEEQME